MRVSRKNMDIIFIFLYFIPGSSDGETPNAANASATSRSSYCINTYYISQFHVFCSVKNYSKICHIFGIEEIQILVFFPFELLFYFRFVFIVDNAMVSVKSEVAQNDKCKENIGSKNTTYFLKDILFPGFFHRANLMKLLGV